MIKPITGVCFCPTEIREPWDSTADNLLQMLRRGLVLDLSVAFGTQ